MRHPFGSLPYILCHIKRDCSANGGVPFPLDFELKGPVPGLHGLRGLAVSPVLALGGVFPQSGAQALIKTYLLSFLNSNQLTNDSVFCLICMVVPNLVTQPEHIPRENQSIKSRKEES